MSIPQTVTVTPEKIQPLLKKATEDQTDVLYRLSHHVIRGAAPQTDGWDDFMELLREGTNRQRLLIIQAAFHMVRRNRMQETLQILR